MHAVAIKKHLTAKTGTVLILALTFLVLLVFNFLTPLISDDYTYRLLYPTTEPLRTVGDVFVSQYNHYMQWGGRTVGLVLEQLFLLAGKWLFNFVTAAAFCLLVWLCAKLCTGRAPVRPLFLLVVLGLLFHFNPCFGAVNLWISGVCSYFYPLLFALCFLLPYRLALDELPRWGKGAATGMFFAGLAAGWGNENTSGAAFLAALGLLGLFWFFWRKIPLWAVTGAAGCLTGFLLLMLAPGQWLRLDGTGGTMTSPLGLLLSRVMNATHTLRAYGLPLLVLLGVLYAALCFVKPGAKALVLPVFWLVLALAANYALVLSPVYYIRSFYPVLAFLVLAIGSCLVPLLERLPGPKQLLAGLLTGGLCVLLAFDLLEGGYDIVCYYTMRTVRDASIVQQVQEGEEHIKTYAVYPYTRFCAAYGQPDLRKSSDNWVNANMALALGAKSISATEQRYYPFPGYDGFSNTVETQLSDGLEK